MTFGLWEAHSHQNDVLNWIHTIWLAAIWLWTMPLRSSVFFLVNNVCINGAREREREVDVDIYDHEISELIISVSIATNNRWLTDYARKQINWECERNIQTHTIFFMNASIHCYHDIESKSIDHVWLVRGLLPFQYLSIIFVTHCNCMLHCGQKYVN